MNGKHKLPNEFVTSAEIDFNRRVDIQAAMQKYICHSISSTINVPKETTKETIGEIYINGWQKGLKGITVYRDGCRTGVLIENTKEVIKEATAPERPESLTCDIHQVKIRGAEWCVFVGLLDGKPYEVFAGKADNVEIPRQYTRGSITRRKSGSYWLSYNETKLNINTCFAESEGNITRLVSTALRYGVPLEYVVLQLGKLKDNVTDISQVLKRELTKYLGTTDDGLQVCTSCGAKAVVREESCYLCKECGSSKCG